MYLQKLIQQVPWVLPLPPFFQEEERKAKEQAEREAREREEKEREDAAEKERAARRERQMVGWLRWFPIPFFSENDLTPYAGDMLAIVYADDWLLLGPSTVNAWNHTIQHGWRSVHIDVYSMFLGTFSVGKWWSLACSRFDPRIVSFETNRLFHDDEQLVASKVKEKARAERLAKVRNTDFGRLRASTCFHCIWMYLQIITIFGDI